MATTTFVDGVTVVEAEWLNEVNDTVFDALGAATTPASARTALDVPKRDGTDATGSWPIDITGEAAEALSITGTSPFASQAIATSAQAQLPINQAVVSVPASGTLNVQGLAPNSDQILVTGGTSIGAMTIAANRMIFVRFASLNTIINSASIVTNTGADVVADQDDVLIFRATATDVVELLSHYKPTNILLQGPVTLTNQTSVDFTAIPSWVRRIKLFFSGLSTNGTSIPQLQIGDAGGIEVTGYAGTTMASGSAGTGSTLATTGVYLTNSWTAATVVNGAFCIEKVDGNLWQITLVAARGDAAFVLLGASAKTLSDTLTQVRLTTVNGTDQFDAGTVNISWE